ncbi:MAG: AAA family ATPase [Candidatus Nomurabacteria bacterium]|jgi:dephospho-CoA kinase|nr:AAA family ATPase [Candidatus Nomurabacteria bacterium]
MSTSNNSPKIIALVGMVGAGKGVSVERLTKKFGWPSVYLGGMVYEEVARRGLDIVKDEIFVREDMRAKEGPAVMAKRAAIKARELLASGAKVVILDGLYSWTEDKFLRQEFGDDIVTIAVVVSKKLRRQRALERADKKRPYTMEEIIRREINEIENLEKGGPIAFADFYVLNDGNLNDLYAQIDEIIGGLGL